MKMKKTVLYTAILAAMGVSMEATADVAIAPDSVGDALLVPFYSAANGNKTFLTVTNSDDSAKAVKVRFREGVGSRDVFDFTLYLSAYDVWSAVIFRAGDDTRVVTQDNSCTVPQVPNSANSPFKFSDTRIPAEYIGNTANRLSEGHIEILEMAVMHDRGNTDIRDAVTHANGTPDDCDLVRTWTAEMAQKDFDPHSPANSSVILGNEPVSVATSSAAQTIIPGTGGLYAHAAVFNPTDGTYFTYAGTALTGWTEDGIVWFPQNSTGLAELSPYTTDLGLAWDEGVDDNGLVEYFDLPDLSTPSLAVAGPGSNTINTSYRFEGDVVINEVDTRNAIITTTGGATLTTTLARLDGVDEESVVFPGAMSLPYTVTNPLTTGGTGDVAVTLPIGSHAAAAKRNAVTTALTRHALANDYITSGGYETEWLVAFPSRYLHVSVPGDVDGDQSNEPDWVFAAPPFTVPEDAKTGEACEVVGFAYWDREEGAETDPGSIDFSPGGSVPDKFQLCYEVNVMAFNQDAGAQTSVLKSTEIAKYVGLDSKYENGWAALDFVDFFIPAPNWQPPVQSPGDDDIWGLPAVGFMAISDTTGDVPRGATFPHHGGSLELDKRITSI